MFRLIVLIRMSAPASLRPRAELRAGVGAARRGQAQAGLLFLIAVIVICVVVVVGLFLWSGGLAETTYRNAVRQTADSGFDVRIESYERGWFSSQGIVSVPIGKQRRVTLTQRIHHGPLCFYDGWHVAFPVAAVVDTDPPPQLNDFLNRTFGDAPLLIETVVAMNGALDTHVSRAPSQRIGPLVTVKFQGLDWHWRLAPDTHLMRGDMPGISATGGFGEVEAAGVVLDGQSHRHGSDLWLGNGSLAVQRVSYSIVARGAHPAASGLAQDLSVSESTTLNSGRIDARLKLAAGEITGKRLKLGPMALEAHLGNLAPEPVEQFRKDAASISGSDLDKAAKERMLRAKAADLLIAIVKQTPVLSIDLDAAGAGGKAIGHAQLVIDGDLAKDPMLKDEAADGKALAARIWNKYASVTADLTVPPALLAQVANDDQIKRLEANGVLVRDGANYICHASYKGGDWTVNGKKFRPPGPPASFLKPAGRVWRNSPRP